MLYLNVCVHEGMICDNAKASDDGKIGLVPTGVTSRVNNVCQCTRPRAGEPLSLALHSALKIVHPTLNKHKRSKHTHYQSL